MERHCRQKPVRVATFHFKITLREALQKNLATKHCMDCIIALCGKHTKE